MRAAFSTWNARIAPVFDTARSVTVIDAESGRIVGRREETLPADLPVRKVLRLADLGASTLVCGAISWPLRAMVAASGIRVIPFVAGDTSEVVQAWVAGTVGNEARSMPGCGGRRERRRGARGPRGGRGRRRDGFGSGRRF